MKQLRVKYLAIALTIALLITSCGPDRESTSGASGTMTPPPFFPTPTTISFPTLVPSIIPSAYNCSITISTVPQGSSTYNLYGAGTSTSAFSSGGVQQCTRLLWSGDCGGLCRITTQVCIACE